MEGNPRRHGGDAETPMKDVGNETAVVNRHPVILFSVRPTCNTVESYGRVNEIVRIPNVACAIYDPVSFKELSMR